MASFNGDKNSNSLNLDLGNATGKTAEDNNFLSALRNHGKNQNESTILDHTKNVETY